MLHLGRDLINQIPTTSSVFHFLNFSCNLYMFFKNTHLRDCAFRTDYSSFH
jgi:hypothetical protein